MAYTAEEALLVEEERAIDQVAQCSGDLLQAERNLRDARAYRERCRKAVAAWRDLAEHESPTQHNRYKGSY